MKEQRRNTAGLSHLNDENAVKHSLCTVCQMRHAPAWPLCLEEERSGMKPRRAERAQGRLSGFTTVAPAMGDCSVVEALSGEL